ncbi:hypothetical protein [Schinkia azotoformans]|uniref:hypothetical protein n=1 Tax=Schinkia azotoformans TaxID=1454 RepID=UPI002DBA0009|nr:hypothetical protein [Schinkia azotoformans]MEC1778422.1 hypothetical protein [Schinkia azotoformans]MED4328333.1 hypothetical protein [Schinkia azotoformans]
MNTSKDNFFYCYDYNMFKHLTDHGHRYITHARNIYSGREFWLYMKSDSLQTLIDEFTNKKNNSKSLQKV